MKNNDLLMIVKQDFISHYKCVLNNGEWFVAKLKGFAEKNHGNLAGFNQTDFVYIEIDFERHAEKYTAENIKSLEAWREK